MSSSLTAKLLDVAEMDNPVAAGHSMAGADSDGWAKSTGVAMAMEESPAYDAIREAGLLTTTYRREGIDQLELLQPNTTARKNLIRRLCSYAAIHGFCTYDATHLEFTVPAGHVQKLRDEQSSYVLAAPGMHCIKSMFWKREGKPEPLRGHVSHGDCTLLVVGQGFVGYCEDNGHPVLLPPGLHQWKSDTLSFVKFIDLNDAVIPIGPYTLLTVDEGYAAVTQNNGAQTILGGGSVHFLNHRNWKFEKFMSLKIQTDELQRIEATSADNVNLQVTSTVNWRICDVRTAAVNAAETMAASGRTAEVKADISKLRKDVLKQSVASLAAFIGAVNYSDSFHMAAAAQASSASASTVVGVPEDAGKGKASHSHSTKHAHVPSGDNPVYDVARMRNAVSEANAICATYGVKILSINILSAVPVDANLTRALASGAVASAEALQAETAARGNAKATLIEADAQAQASLVEAQAAAEAERVRAKGAKDAADLLSSNQVAIDLAKMNAQAGVLGDKSKLIIGSDSSMLGNVLLRPDKLGMATDA